MSRRFFNATLTLILLVSFPVSGFTYSKKTQKELSKVHPRLADNFSEVSSEMKKFYPDLRFEIGWRGGQRTCEEQMDLFKQGRSKPGPIVTNARCWQTYHTVLGATDFVVFRKGRLDWNIWKNRLFRNRFAGIVRGNGLVWGGDFRKFPDYGHVQLPYSLSFLQKLCGYNGCNGSESSKIRAIGGSKTNIAKSLIPTNDTAKKKTSNDKLQTRPTLVKSQNTNSTKTLQTGLPIVFRELPGQVCRLKGGILYCKTA